MVAPFAGAWIEIERKGRNQKASGVAPFAGAWIEIMVKGIQQEIIDGRSLRGSVD